MVLDIMKLHQLCNNQNRILLFLYKLFKINILLINVFFNRENNQENSTEERSSTAKYSGKEYIFMPNIFFKIVKIVELIWLKYYFINI